MEEKIKELYHAIQLKGKEAVKYSKLFGADHSMTTIAFRQMEGMETAFKILTGMDTTDYLLQRLEERYGE